MNFLKKHKISIGILLVVSLLLINAFIFPFQKADPNFSDVERVFSRMQFPAEWEEIASSENRGMFGRKCAFEEESWCFHKSKTYKINEVSDIDIAELLKDTGCPSVTTKETTSTSGNTTTSYSCSIEGLSVVGSYNERKEELYIAVRS